MFTEAQAAKLKLAGKHYKEGVPGGGSIHQAEKPERK